MVKFEFLIDSLPNKKGDVVEMHKSTADALVAHKIGKIVGKAKVKPVSQKTGKK